MRNKENEIITQAKQLSNKPALKNTEFKDDLIELLRQSQQITANMASVALALNLWSFTTPRELSSMLDDLKKTKRVRGNEDYQHLILMLQAFLAGIAAR